MDFTLAVGAWHNARLVQWSCKPRELIESAPNKVRIAERIELERLYSMWVSAMHVVIDGTQFPGLLAANLDWLRPLRSEVLQLLCPRRLQDYAGELMALSAEESLGGAKARTRERMRLETGPSEHYFRAAAWLALIDIDLSQPVVYSLPLKRDTGGLRARLARELLGEQHVC